MSSNVEPVDRTSALRVGLRSALVVFAAACSCATVQNSTPASMRGGWFDMLKASGGSSARPAGPAASYTWTGADKRNISVSVAAPNVAGRPTESISPVSGDNGPQIDAALSRLKAAGGGTLRLSPGEYVLAGGPPALALSGLKDVAIEGRGATLTFSAWGDGIAIQNCQRLAVRGLSLRYAKPAVLAAVVRQTARGNELMVAPSQTTALNGAKIYQVTEYDKAGKGFVPKARRLLLGRNGESPVGDGARGFTLPSGKLNDFADGRPVEVKLSYYNGAAVRIADPGDTPVSADITFDGLTVQNSPGMGIAVDLMGSGLAVLNSQIGVRSPTSNAVTVAYDALHVTAMTGNILLRGNQFTASGDDAINISSPIYDVSPGSDAKDVTLKAKTGGVYLGATLAFFDADLRWLGNDRIVKRSSRSPDAQIGVAFSDTVPQGARYARNVDLLSSRYAILNNEIFRCQCHGVLAQTPNGIIAGNRFTSLRANAIRLVVSAWWHEGSAVRNVVVRDNIITDTGDDGRRGVVWGAITLYAELGDDGGQDQPAVATQTVNDTVLIADNTISGVDQGCISVASSAHVRITGNRCQGFNRRLDKGQLLVEKTDPVAGIKRLSAKTSYLGQGNGIWIDPLSTSNIDHSS
ncbi:conserved hypothetical protein [Sphingomonas sp. 8AM]|nr:conserved hypothetical protein [Sphingomonas sp. 8AM]